jgi:hypothetical protein
VIWDTFIIKWIERASWRTFFHDTIYSCTCTRLTLKLCFLWCFNMEWGSQYYSSWKKFNLSVQSFRYILWLICKVVIKLVNWKRTEHWAAFNLHSRKNFHTSIYRSRSTHLFWKLYLYIRTYDSSFRYFPLFQSKKDSFHLHIWVGGVSCLLNSNQKLLCISW